MDDRIVTVEQFEFLPEAEAIRLRLEAAGIEVFLADAETVSTDWALGNAIGYIKLQVHEFNSEAARAVIKEVREIRKARANDTTSRCLSCDAEFSTTATVCPHCGWSFESDDSETDENSDVSPSDAQGGEAEGPGTMEALRSLKKPIMSLILLPILVSIALTVILAFSIFVGGVLRF